MKKVLLVAAIAAMFFGCSSKQPVVEADKGDLPTATEGVYFDFDKYFVRDDQFGAVASNVIYLNNGAVQGTGVILEGNCDEWGSDEYNYALGLKRAKAVKDALIEGGVSATRISIISNGESKPVCNLHNKECWDENRRVDTYTVE